MFLYSCGFSKYHILYAVKKFDNDIIKNELKKFLSGYSLSSKKIIDRLSNGMPYNLFVYGKSNGTGKTTVLHLLALFFYNNRLKFNRPTFLFDQISAIFKLAKKDLFDRESSGDVLQLMCDVDLLFIDDIDKSGKLTNFEMENFRLVLDYRYRNLKPVFLSANASLSSLLSLGCIDSAIYSRLKETTLSINLDGKDNRIKRNTDGLDKFLEE